MYTQSIECCVCVCSLCCFLTYKYLNDDRRLVLCSPSSKLLSSDDRQRLIRHFWICFAQLCAYRRFSASVHIISKILCCDMCAVWNVFFWVLCWLYIYALDMRPKFILRVACAMKFNPFWYYYLPFKVTCRLCMCVLAQRGFLLNCTVEWGKTTNAYCETAVHFDRGSCVCVYGVFEFVMMMMT